MFYSIAKTKLAAFSTLNKILVTTKNAKHKAVMLSMLSRDIEYHSFLSSKRLGATKFCILSIFLLHKQLFLIKIVVCITLEGGFCKEIILI